MNREEIDYWLKSFSNNNQSFMSKDGKIITLFKVFQELKELHFLLKIKNDYIKELEGYKHNLDRDCLKLEKENKILREENKRLYKTIEELSQYQYDREEEDMMNYIIEQEEVFNDYSFMEEL